MVAFDNKLRQILFIILIIVLGVLLMNQLTLFFPGILGGVTLYIVSREWYYKLVYHKKWSKGWTALLFIIGYLIMIGLPVFFTIKLISPRINSLVQNQHEVLQGVKAFSTRLSKFIGVQILNEEKLRTFGSKISTYIPTVLNSTLNLITNMIMMFFLFYYMLVSGKSMEKFLLGFIPLKPESIRVVAHETRILIKANALGIPLISLVQGGFAALGYWMFGVQDWGMWGFITGVFAFFPVVGTMIIWIPLVIYLYSSNHNVSANNTRLVSVDGKAKTVSKVNSSTITIP